MNLSMRSVDWQLQIIRTNTITMRIRIAKETAKQHAIRAGTNARDHIRRLERGLLDLSEEVLRVAIQYQATNRNRRIIAMRPGLGQVKGIETILLCVRKGHNLHLKPPDREVIALDCFAQVATMVIRIFRRHRLGFSIGEVLDTLLRLEVILDPEFLASRVNPHK